MLYYPKEKYLKQWPLTLALSPLMNSTIPTMKYQFRFGNIKLGKDQLKILSYSLRPETFPATILTKPMTQATF